MKHLTFKQAAYEAIKGKKIARPGWGGYWYFKDGQWKIHLKTGEELVNNFTGETIWNTLAEDWEVLEERKGK